MILKLLVSVSMIAIPIGLTILINFWLRKRIDKRLAMAIAMTPIIIIVFICFRACYPGQAFYQGF